jgi:hypothetical protein
LHPQFGEIAGANHAQRHVANPRLVKAERIHPRPAKTEHGGPEQDQAEVKPFVSQQLCRRK